MATVAPPARERPQYLGALDRANSVRMAAVEVKRALADGDITLADALADERAGCIAILDLLKAQHGWGNVRAQRLLGDLMIRERRRVDALTVRQCLLISAAAAKTPSLGGRR